MTTHTRNKGNNKQQGEEVVQHIEDVTQIYTCDDTMSRDQYQNDHNLVENMQAISLHVRTISSHSNPSIGVASLSTLESVFSFIFLAILNLQIFSNILAHPEIEKYQKLSAKSTTFKSKVADVEGALELISFVGFRPVVLEFEL